ncbi:MAG: T9SS type A sorting domain-containing protein [Chitinophagaceae bacterium]|nr:T9SS type A sorting domain-containing protein [Chitinophagaceae bacterium]MCB9044722.1 T9SS type A sorting domain-containing protein [Chitinophagales bacterium]
MNISRILSIILFLTISNVAFGQNMPIGQWRSHLPYNSAVSIATDGVKMYVATQYSFYTLDIVSDEPIPYSKVSGMSDVGMSKIAYDDFTGTVIMTYENSNIDLFKNGSFYNIPDLKLKTVTGTKTVNQILTEDGLAYLSTDVGIVVVNLAENEIKETYNFTKNSENIPVKGLVSLNNLFYAATDKGLYKINKDNPGLQSFQEWTALDTSHNFVSIASTQGRVFLALQDTVFVLENDTMRNIYQPGDSLITNIEEGINSLWVVQYNDTTFQGIALRMNMDYQFTDTINTLGKAIEMIDIADPDSTKWVASIANGLKKRTRKGSTFSTYAPAGPGDIANFDIYARDKDLVVAHGGFDDKYRPLGNGNGFSVYKENEWKSYKIFDYAPFGDSVVDISNILKGPKGEIYAGSTESGLFILSADGSTEYYKQNSFIDPSSTGSTLYRIGGMTFDNDGVLWLTVLGGTPHELVSRTIDGQWHQYTISANRTIANSAGYLITDDVNQKWYAAPGGGGLIVYDDNHTPEVPGDDTYIQLQSGEGSGGLPDNEVLCLANDKSGAVWIGTANGIGIVNCPSQVIQRQCEAEKRIVQFDQFAGYLFQNEQVRTIAVDGANRKWIGTNNGVWLISANGDEIIERFTKDNSPLPSDIIQKITIDPLTGDVYIGTEMGLMSYHGTAIDGGKQNNDLITYPNPVPSGYTGTIAIKGFVENADVRITDISGQLVYRTTALGGQAVWNGKDYTGRRPQSGVYLIFGTNKDGSETVKGKMVFME